RARRPSGTLSRTSCVERLPPTLGELVLPYGARRRIPGPERALGLGTPPQRVGGVPLLAAQRVAVDLAGRSERDGVDDADEARRPLRTEVGLLRQERVEGVGVELSV